MVDLLHDPVLYSSILGESVDTSRIEVVQNMLDRLVNEPLYLPI